MEKYGGEMSRCASEYLHLAWKCLSLRKHIAFSAWNPSYALCQRGRIQQIIWSRCCPVYPTVCWLFGSGDGKIPLQTADQKYMGGCLLFCVFLSRRCRRCGSLCINTEGSNPWHRLGHTGTATWYNYGLYFIPIPPTGLQIRWFNNSIFPAFTLVRLSGSNRFKVYDSEHFASLIVANNITDITCDYVGLLQLAKNYGTFRMYHVRRSHEPE